MTTITIVIKPTIRIGLYDAYIEGRVRPICRSRQPFYESARRLAALALADPNVILEMKHAGSDVVALRGNLLRAAKLTIAERDRDGLSVENWRPAQLAEGLP